MFQRGIILRQITRSNLIYILMYGILGFSFSIFFQNCGEGFKSGSSLSENILQVRAPVAKDLAVTLDEDSLKQGQLSATSAVASALIYKAGRPSQKGTLVVNLDGSFIYTPFSNANGSDSFTFTVSDGDLTSNEATVSLTINPVNDLPVASNSTLNTNQDVSITGQLIAQDMDADQLTYEIVTPPAKGSIQNLVSSSGKFTFVPNGGAKGTDSFTFRAKDSSGVSAAATVKINLAVVNVAPVVQDLKLKTLETTPVNGKLLGTDGNGDPLTFAIVKAPLHGSIQNLNASSGTFTYVPTAKYSGSDNFLFTASDGSLTSIQKTVSIEVVEVNRAPVAKNSNITTNQNTAAVFDLVATDADGDALTYKIANQPKTGLLVQVSGKTFRYTPNTNFSGSDSFLFVANDGKVDSLAATVTISVQAPQIVLPPLPPFPLVNKYPYYEILASFIDKSGNIFIATPTDIRRYDSKGNMVLRFGKLGSASGDFHKPSGIVVDSAGNIFVSDTGNNRIQKFTGAGKFLVAFGSMGSGDGQLLAPMGLAIDAQNNVLVADSGNGRVQKFSSSGTFIKKIGKKYQGPFIISNGEFLTARSIAVDSVGNIYVADRSERVQKFDSQGNFLLKIERKGSGQDQFSQAATVAIDAQNTVYVRGNVAILTFSTNGSFIALKTRLDFRGAADFNIDSQKNIYFIYSSSPSRRYLFEKSDASGDKSLLTLDRFDPMDQIALDSQGNIFVSSNLGSAGDGASNITKFSKSGQLIKKFGSFGIGDGQFVKFHIAIDSKDNIWVSDFGRTSSADVHRLQKFDNAGNLIAKYDIPENPASVSIHAIAIDNGDNLYLLDYNYGTQTNSVLKFNSSGQLLSKIALPKLPIGTGVFLNNSLYGLKVNSTNEFLIVAGGNIHRLNSQGSLLQTIGIPESSNGETVRSIEVDSLNNIYATSGRYKVFRFDAGGNLQLQFGSRGSELGMFDNYQLAVDVDSLGNIYVAEDRRIQKFSPAGKPLDK